MNKKYTIVFSDLAEKQLKSVDKLIRSRIVQCLESKAANSPRSFGKSLLGNFRGMWCYRVGEYRIICKIKDDELIVAVVKLGHRKEVYDR